MSLPIDTARTSDPDTVPQVAPRSAAAPQDRAGTPADPTEDVADLDRAMREFSEIGGTLVEAYGALAERAERVEGELARTNRALEDKVRELDEVTRHLEAILEALPTGVVVRDATGRITTINRAALSILEREREELLGSADPPALLSSEGTAGATERELERADGSRLVLASRYAPIPGDAESDDPGGSVEILDDRTEIAELSDRVHGMDKMAALGTMAAGIAHEIRNPLNAVSGFASLLERELAEGTKARRWASNIVAGALETDSIIRSMLTFARPNRLVTETVDPEALVADALRTALNKTELSLLTVTSRVDAPTFVGDRIKLRQAIRNLISNAATVQPTGGAIHVELVRSGGLIVARVSDAGPGIPPELARRVLDPFFTTRAEGTGLGLALVSTIAQAHGGDVRVQSEPSSLGGACIELRLPLRDLTNPHAA